MPALDSTWTKQSALGDSGFYAVPVYVDNDYWADTYDGTSPLDSSWAKSSTRDDTWL